VSCWGAPQRLIPAGEQSGLLTHSAASPYHLLRNYRTFAATDFQLVTIGIFKEKRVVAFPHLVKGITRETSPNVFGGSPVSNLVVGWVGLTITFVIASFVDIKSYPFGTTIAAALGIPLIGLFHAGPERLWAKAVRDECKTQSKYIFGEGVLVL